MAIKSKMKNDYGTKVQHSLISINDKVTGIKSTLHLRIKAPTSQRLRVELGNESSLLLTNLSYRPQWIAILEQSVLFSRLIPWLNMQD